MKVWVNPPVKRPSEMRVSKHAKANKTVTSVAFRPEIMPGTLSVFSPACVYFNQFHLSLFFIILYVGPLGFCDFLLSRDSRFIWTKDDHTLLDEHIRF